MNETIDHLVWPVVYVELGRDEELMLISDTDWFHDIDAKHAIGPIEDGQHYFVDAVSQVFKLREKRGRVCSVEKALFRFVVFCNYAA